jgi:hypothetical protein
MTSTKLAGRVDASTIRLPVLLIVPMRLGVIVREALRLKSTLWVVVIG